MIWQQGVSLLSRWYVVIAALAVTVALCRWILRRRRDRDAAGPAVFVALVVSLQVVALALAAATSLRSWFGRPTSDVQRAVGFYLLYGCLAALVVPWGLALLLDLLVLPRDFYYRLRRCRMKRWASHGIDGLVEAAQFRDYRRRRTGFFRTEWWPTWDASELALWRLVEAGGLQRLFEVLQQRRAWDHLRRLLGELARRKAGGGVAPLFSLLAIPAADLRRLVLATLDAQDSLDLTRHGRLEPLTALLNDTTMLPTDRQGKVAEAALGLISRMDMPGRVDALISALQSPWKHLRPRAAELLGKLQDRRAVAPLLQVLASDDHLLVTNALRALAAMPDVRAAQPLASLLRRGDCPSPAVAIDLLGGLGDRSVVDAIVPFFVQAGDSRVVAARALAKLGWAPADPVLRAWFFIAAEQWNACAELGEPAVAPLLGALPRAKRQQLDIAGTLGRIGDERAVAPLSRLLRGKASEERLAIVADALGQLGASGLAALTEAAGGEPDAQRAALVVLRQRSPKHVPQFVERLLAGQETLSGEALDLLVSIGRPAVGPLCEAFVSSAGARRSAILLTIVRIGGLPALRETLRTHDAAGLQALLDDLQQAHAQRGPDATLQRALRDLLVGMPSADLAGAVVDRLRQEAPIPQQTVVELLTAAGPEASQPLLDLLSGSQQKEVLSIAVEVLSRTGEARAVEPIIAAIKEGRISADSAREDLVRFGPDAVDGLCDLLRAGHWAAIGMLAKIGDRRARGPLAEALQTRSASVVEGCAAALEALGWQPSDDDASAWYLAYKGDINACSALGERAVPALSFAVEYFTPRSWNDHPGDERLRDQAIDALGRAGDGRALEELIPLLSDGSKDVRERAARSIINLARTATFTEEQRLRLLDARRTITAHTDSYGAHTDHARHFDKSTYVSSHDCYDSSTAHDDVPNPEGYSAYAKIGHKDLAGPHSDRGLGMHFPL